MKKSDIQRFLFVMHGGIEPRIVGGPYPSEANRTAGIITALKKFSAPLAEDGSDTIHTLDIPRRGKPKMRSFSGGFMSQLRRLAEGKCPDNSSWLIYHGAAVYPRGKKAVPGS